MARNAVPSGENQSVTCAIDILDLLASNAEPIGVREIARRLALAPSNVQRLIKTLTKAGFLEQTQGTLRYRISLPVGSAFVGAKQPLLGGGAGTLRTGQHITGFLGVRRNHALGYLATVQSEGPVAITHRPGSQTYLHSTAMGKALLAEMQNDKIRVLLGTRPLPRTPSRSWSRKSKPSAASVMRQARKKTGKASFLLGRWCAM